MIRKNEIFSTCMNNVLSYNVCWLNIGLFHFSLSFNLVSLLFTPPLPSNPIYHQLYHRECFYILVSLLLIHNWMHILSKNHGTIEIY